MSVEDRIKISKHVMGKLKQYYPTIPLNVRSRALSSRTRWPRPTALFAFFCTALRGMHGGAVLHTLRPAHVRGQCAVTNGTCQLCIC